MSLLGSCEEDDSTPNWLGDDVQDGKGENFSVSGPLAGSLGEGPNDGVESPNNDESEGDLVVEGADLGGSDKGVRSSRSDEGVVDVEESSKGEGKEAPSEVEVWVNGSDESGDDHDDISEDDDDDFSDGQTSKEGQVEQEQRSGDEPVDVSGHQELSLGAE